MTSIMLSSNVNSAMIQTIEASESRRNPNVYSTETIYPAHAMTWVKCEKSSGTIGAGSQLNFQLQKYGIISHMLLCYTKQFTAGNNALPAGDIFKTIRQVELLVSSKTVSILTAEDLMAQFSDCKQSEFNVVRETALLARAGVISSAAGNPAAVPPVPADPVTAATIERKYVVPLTFAFFESVNTQLDSSFLEPLQIRITWGTPTSSDAGTTDYAADPIADCHLLMRYKNYDEQTTASMISANYSAPQLNQLSSRFYDEAKTTHTVATGKESEQKVDIDLKNTECVESFYVIVRKKNDDSTEDAVTVTPCKTFLFTGSGQQICDLRETQLQYARLGMNGWSEAVDNTVATSGCQLSAIAKVQLGLNHKGMVSSCLSLREVNAPRICVTFDAPAEADYKIACVQKVFAVYATSSATGRLSLMLSN